MEKLYISTAPHLWHGIRYTNDAGDKKVRATVKCAESSWPKICKALAQIKTATKKEKCPYFVFAKFSEKDDNGEYTRRNANIEQFYGATIDVDDSPFSFEEVEQAVKAQGWNYFIYTTFSYDPWAAGKENKFRLVLPYSTPVDPEEQPYVIMGIAAKLGIDQTYDKASEVASQPMYWHSAPKERIQDGMYSGTSKGTFLDPEEVHELGRMVAEEQGVDRRGKVVAKGTDLSAGDRHDQFKRFLARCRMEGMTVDEAIGEVHVWNSKLSDPLPDDDIEGLRRVWETFERNNNSFGFEHHRHNIEHLGVREKTVYDAVMQQMASSDDQLDAAERRELFELIKKNRPGSTLKTIEEHYKELTVELVEEASLDLMDLRQKVDVWLQKQTRDLIWASETEKVYNRKDGVGVSLTAFKLQMGKLFETKAFQRFGPAFLELKLGREYAITSGIIHEVARQGYYPGEDLTYTYKGVEYLNRYVKPEIEAFEGDVEPLMDHLEYLIPDAKERGWFICMLAYACQNPGRLIRYMYVIEGGKGIGKSILRKRLLEPLFGNRNVQEVTAEMLADDKRAWVSDAQVDVFEEFAFPSDKAGKASTHNFLKKYIANEDVPRRAMRTDFYEVPNFSMKIAFKNPEDKIKIDRDDRRYVIVRGPRKMRSRAYYDRLCDWLDDPINMAAVRHYFYNFDYFAKGFTPDFPLKNAFTNEVASQVEEWPASVLDIVGDHPDSPLDPMAPFMFESDLIKLVVACSAQHGYEALQAEKLVTGARVQRRLFRDTLESLGFVDISGDRFKRRVNGIQRWERVWFLSGMCDAELERCLEEFNWHGHEDELNEFSSEVGHFIKRLHKEREQDQAMISGSDWDEGGEQVA